MSIIFILLLGITIGLWMSLSKGTFLILLFAFIIFFISKYSIPKEDRSFVFKVIVIGLILRITLAILYYYFYLALGYADILGPDGEIYSQRAWYISRILLNQNPYIVPNVREYIFKNFNSLVEYYQHALPPVNSYQIGFFSYFLALLYAIFDYSPFLMKFINSIFSILTGVTIYFIGKEVFNSKVGKVSMILFIFLPSTCIFSITVLKDSIIIFLLTTVIWLMMKFQKDKRLPWLILAAVATIALGALRYAAIYPLMIVIATILFLSWRTGIFQKVIFVMLVSIVVLLSPLSTRIKHVLQPDNLFNSHLGYVTTPGNNYKIFPERCYYQGQLVGIGPMEITAAFIKGIFHLLYEPLPYRINGSSKTLFFAFLQNILLYLLTPFIIVGFGRGLRYRPYQIMPLTMYLIIFISLMAISEGNVGTVFRHREMLMPFLIILGIAGCYARLGRNNFAVLNK